MTLQEIIEQKDWWYIKEDNYVMDSDWVNQYIEPAPYPAFVWWDDYKLRTPRLYVEIVIKERTEEHVLNSKSDMTKYRYAVTISGAISEFPLPIEHWEYNGNPWKNHSMYIDCFYFGRKYKHLDEEYIGKQPGTSSTLIKGFNNLDEAKEFVEMWKAKVIEDHKEYIEEDKEIMKII